MGVFIRYVGTAPRPEPASTGRGGLWYPGEARYVDDVVGRLLRQAGGAWQRTTAREAGCLPVTVEQAEAILVATTLAGLAEGVVVAVSGRASVRVGLVPHTNRFTVIKIFQANAHGDAMPLGFMVAHMGKRRSQEFTLEADAVSVWWEQSGRYLAQSAPGVPEASGVLTYPEQLGAPQSVEVY